MKGRFPRTPVEFRDHQRSVALGCSNGHRRFVRPENLIQRLGPDFDLYDGYAEISEAFDCPSCGAPHPHVSFCFTGERSKQVSFEEALVSELELRAFARARDAAYGNTGFAAQGSGGGRSRKFGARHRR